MALLKTYYLHGFASRFDITSEKLKTLAILGPVYGHDMDYTKAQRWLLRKAWTN